MSDKEKIKQEIERIEQILDDFNKTHNNTIDNGIVSAKKNICKHIKSFINSLPEEPESEDLEEAAKHYLYGAILYDDVYTGNPTEEDCIRCFKAGAEWQKQKDQSTIELAEDHAMLAGMEKMREEMMKGALSGQIYRSYDGDVDILAVKGNTDKLYRGTDIKFIIVKEN